MIHRMKRAFVLLTVFFLFPMLSGCWNYREIDKLDTVAGVAVDKGTTAKYKVTIDIVQISHEKDAGPKSRIVSSEGDSVFDAVRDAIAITGRRLYWSHSKVLIVSQDVAKEGIVKILDWYSRDSETRADVRLLISREKTAGEIFTEPSLDSDIISIKMHEAFVSQKSMSKTPDIEVWRFINRLASPGMSPIAAAVRLKEEDGKKMPELYGTAVFLHDEFLGFLDEAETFDMQMIQDKVKGGIIVINEQGKEGELVISLEIFGNKTKIKPMFDKEGRAAISVSTKTEVAIDEIEGIENYIEDGMREKLEQMIESFLETDLEDNIKLVQTEFGSDIFGFGNKIYLNYPKFWNTISEKWLDMFKELRVDVDCDVHIRNSAVNAKTVPVGD